MDLAIRYFDESSKQVQTVYFNSVFYQRSTAEDLVIYFLGGLSGIPLDEMIQISMDGPNVNWSFLKKIEDRLEVLLTGQNPELAKLFNLGSCGLHVAHGAFKTGCTKTAFGCQKILSAGYYLFKDSPSRRAEFTEITNSDNEILSHSVVGKHWPGEYLH